MLFEDTFQVTDEDPEGRKFDKVSRITATSTNYDMEMVLDYNCEIYRLRVNDSFNLALVKTLALDGTVDEKDFDQSNVPNQADSYEYVMHGTVFQIDGKADRRAENMTMYVSFGGLMLSLKGDAKNLQKITLDKDVYLLIRKVNTSG